MTNPLMKTAFDVKEIFNKVKWNEIKPCLQKAEMKLNTCSFHVGRKSFQITFILTRPVNN